MRTQLGVSQAKEKALLRNQLPFPLDFQPPDREKLHLLFYPLGPWCFVTVSLRGCYVCQSKTSYTNYIILI